MKTSEIPETICQAITTILGPYVPNLTPAKLQNIIAFEPDDTPAEKLLSRKETATALNVSLPTVDRMLADNELSRVPVRGRIFVRQSAVNKIING